MSVVTLPLSPATTDLTAQASIETVELPHPVRWLVAIFLLGTTGCNGTAAYAASSFDANDEAWSLNGDAAAQVELRSVGGNPGGHICGKDSVNGDIWYFIAPPRFLGDASRTFGKRLTWDLKQDNMYQQLKGRDVVLQGNGLSLVFNIKATPAKEWTAYEARLDGESGWKFDDAAQPAATEEQVRQVLKAITSLRLRGEFADGPDSACLDNVFLGLE